ENGARPSFAGDAWYWVVAEPNEITSISAELRTEVIRESAETLNLYMVVLPSAQSSDAPASQLGTVIDAVDSYRLVETEAVPANVRPVIDAGLVVEKVAPAPPDQVSQPGDRPELAEGDIWGLMGDVDPGRIESVIAELQASGSNDGSGIGTRHYTTTGNQIAAEYLYRELESYGLDVWYEDFVSWDGFLLVNVVGQIPGRDESRLYGVMAHFDTTSDTPLTSAPGADDNATGVAASLEIARILSGFDVKHPVRVIFVNYEEVGVVGSQEFARDAVAAGDPWEGVFNVDSVGSARNGSQIVLNATGDSVWMEDLITRVNDAYGLGERIEILQSEEIVADDSRLRDQGLESVLIARELYGWSPVHHSDRDLIGEVSIPHTQSAATLVLLSVASLLV
ncbi:MAG TPA: M20/M25/M40 family metallo-hydrolase, partial [Thermomicrobiales bacterium]|nr:M20/M25/M40 family metallo-hydrolase [Thermomicrobiales bacterium]